jgi:hypothetical protein
MRACSTSGLQSVHSPLEHCNYTIQEHVLCLQFAFPDDEYLPSLLLQRAPHPRIARRIGLELARPEFGARLRCRCELTALVPMPKASMNKDDRRVSAKYDVGTSRKIAAMQPESVTCAVQQRAHLPLRSGVAPADPRHDLRSFGFGKDVGHTRQRIRIRARIRALWRAPRCVPPEPPACRCRRRCGKRVDPC